LPKAIYKARAWCPRACFLSARQHHHRRVPHVASLSTPSRIMPRFRLVATLACILLPVGVVSVPVQTPSTNPCQPLQPTNVEPHVAAATVPVYLAMSTVPPRQHACEAALESLSHLRPQPNGVILSAVRAYTRWPTQKVNLSQMAVPIGLRLERTYCNRDHGPGSKLICALPVVQRLVRRLPVDARNRTLLVLIDDDTLFHSHLVESIRDAAARQTAPTAFSWHVYDLYLDAPSSVQGSEALCVGQAANALAVPLIAAMGASDYLACMKRLTQEAPFHDDLWIASYLWDVSRVPVHRLPPPTGVHAGKQSEYNAREGLFHLKGVQRRGHLNNALMHARHTTLRLGLCGVVAFPTNPNASLLMDATREMAADASAWAEHVWLSYTPNWLVDQALRIG